MNPIVKVAFPASGERPAWLPESDPGFEDVLFSFGIPGDADDAHVVFIPWEFLGNRPTPITPSGQLVAVFDVPHSEIARAVESGATAVIPSGFQELLLHELRRCTGKMRARIQQADLEARLRIDSAMLNTVSNVARVGGWELDLETNTAIHTEMVRELHDLPVSGPMDLESALAFYPSPAREQLIDALDRARTLGEPFDLTLPFQTASGRKRMVRCQSVPIIENGKPRKLIGAFQDVTEQHQRTETLRRQANLLDKVRDSITGFDLDGVLTYWNPAAALSIGYAPDQALGKITISDLVAPSLRSEMREIFQNVVQGHEWRGEFDLRRADGSEIPTYIRLGPDQDPDGNVCGVVSLHVEIAEQKAIRERLEETNKRFDQIASQSNSVLWETDPDGIFRYISGQIINQLGYTPEEMIGRMGYPELFPDDLRDAQHATLRAFAQKREAYRSFENCVVAKDGRRIWVTSNGFPIYNSAGDYIGYRGIDTDITDLKTSRDALDILSNRLQLAQEAAGFGTWDWNPAEGYSVWDFRMREIYRVDWDLSHVALGDWLGLMHPDDRPDVTSKMDAIDRCGDQFEAEFRILWPDGSIRHLSSRGLVLRDESGVVSRVVGIDRDVTAETELRERLREEKDRVEAASRARSEFLAMMSHEIRTPMNSVIGFCELLSGTDMTEEQDEYVEMIRTAGTALLEIIDAILDFSKLEAGKFRIRIETFDPVVTALEICDLLRPIAKTKGVECAFDASPDIDSGMLSDPFAYRRIVTNLVGNAIKFTESGRVDVKLRKREGDINYLEIIVSDTGVGMTDDVIARLFQPFQQGDSTHNRKFGGTGLGLSISRRLAEALDGTLIARQRPEGGSEFVLTLPCTSVPQDSPPAPTPSVSTFCPPGPLHVLLAEDNPVNQRLVALMLKRLACSFEVASNGLEAVEACRQSSFDAILMDVQMPEMDGWTAIREIRKIEASRVGGKRQPIIVLSAYATSGDRSRSLEHGADAHLSKPLTSAALANTLRELT